MEDFFKPKIVYGQFQDNAEYSFAESGVFLSSNEYLLITKNYSSKCLLAFLNAKVSEWYLSIITGNLGGNSKIGQKSNFLKLAVAKLPLKTQQYFEQQVDKILLYPKSILKIEREINTAIYNIYGLTDDDIQIIESQ